MARTSAARPMSLPAATWSMPLPRRCEASTTALRRSPGQSGIPEVPSSGLPSPPSSPPLAAITATNELALFPKTRGSGNSASGGSSSARPGRRGGAALRIREECERFFCETMKAVFQGERNMAGSVSGLTGVYHIAHHQDSPNGQLCTPPSEYGHLPALTRTVSAGSSVSAASAVSGPMDPAGPAADGFSAITAWLEVWDYAGGNSFRGFLCEDLGGDRTLFAFFDRGVVERDVKQALMALLELADSAIGCSQVVLCVDRRAVPADIASLIKGLQWAGFSATTLDAWTGGKGVDVTSPAWIFMGMEL